jgi:hypothetical protein
MAEIVEPVKMVRKPKPVKRKGTVKGKKVKRK